MTFRRSLVAACLFSITATPAFADKVSDSMDKAKSLYEKGDIGKSYTELQIATSLVGRKLSAIYAKTFPAAPAGWKTRRTRSNNQSGVMMAQGFVMNRRYSQDGGSGRIRAQLIIDNPMITAMTGMFSNPAMAARMNYDRVQVEGGGEAWVKYEEDRKRGEVVLVLASRIFIKLSGTRIESGDILTKLVSTWDFATLKKTVGIN